ncbi:unnamed protein product [Polarella glacialis]|uniref:Uncharacterized protein n=1 Tax=Polarella glacialis TaxID=89957 RepID=A0A813HHI5_POLGL|nr:unnamed protein product [Polarella glacialis]
MSWGVLPKLPEQVKLIVFVVAASGQSAFCDAEQGRININNNHNNSSNKNTNNNNDNNNDNNNHNNNNDNKNNNNNNIVEEFSGQTVLRGPIENYVADVDVIAMMEKNDKGKWFCSFTR